MEINALTAQKAWEKALKHILTKGKVFNDTDQRACREVLGVTIRITETKDVTKPITMLNSTGKWVYPPLEEMERVMLTKKDLPGYYYTYGARAFNFINKNQVDEYLIPLLKKDPSSRRGSLVFYQPTNDSFSDRTDVPGMIMLNCNVKEGKLDVTTVIRSNDVFFGWPANIYQVSVLQKYIAKELKVGLGTLTTFSISAHVFEDQEEHIKRLLKT